MSSLILPIEFHPEVAGRRPQVVLSPRGTAWFDSRLMRHLTLARACALTLAFGLAPAAWTQQYQGPDPYQPYQPPQQPPPQGTGDAAVPQQPPAQPPPLPEGTPPAHPPPRTEGPPPAPPPSDTGEPQPQPGQQTQPQAENGPEEDQGPQVPPE